MDFIEGLSTSGGSNCILSCWTCFPSIPISCRRCIPLQHQWLLKHSWLMSTSSMDCLRLLSPVVTKFSLAHFDMNYSSWLVWSWEWVLLIIRGPMAKRSVWINAWRRSCVVLFMHVPSSGVSGWIKLNFGTIQHGILHWVALLLKSSMGILHDSLVLLSVLILPLLTWNQGCLIVLSWQRSYASI